MHKHAASTLCALAMACSLAGLAGCNQSAKQAPIALSKFDAQIVGGILTHDIVLTNRSLRSLEQVELTITVYFESKVETYPRHWAYWKHDEPHTVNVPNSGRIQRITIAGTANADTDAVPVQLSADWLVGYEQAKQAN